MRYVTKAFALLLAGLLLLCGCALTDILILPPADTDGPEETGDPVTDGAVQTEADGPAETEEEHFTSAVDALRIDRNDLFLYADVKITGSEYTLSYYMPGGWAEQPLR